MNNFKIFNLNIALYDREINLLKENNFEEEIHKSKIPEDKQWILTDLKNKGVLYEFDLYYQGTVVYKQIKDIL